MTADAHGTDWEEHAACRLPGAPDMYPVDDKGVRIAQMWCAGCPVLEPCAAEGLAEPHGVWGGMSERARARARRQLGITARITRLDDLLHPRRLTPEEEPDDDHDDDRW